MHADWVRDWLLIFYMYCFFGWCFESSYVSLRTGHWVNRGFMKAPFLPLYGSGAMLLLIVGLVFERNTVMIYIAGCICATILELVTGAGMEWLFHIKYWDYSRQRFQYKGHICLSSALVWGFMALLVNHVLHGPLEDLVRSLPEAVVTALVLVLTIVLGWDFAQSFRAAITLRGVLVSLEETRTGTEALYGQLRDMCEHANVQVQRAVEERLERLETLDKELAGIQANIQAELTANYEVHISKQHRLTEESNPEVLMAIKEEYRQWKSRFYEGQHKWPQKLDISEAKGMR